MMKTIYRLLHKLFRRCDHVKITRNEKGDFIQAENLCVVGSWLPIGDWKTEPHPVPAFRDKIKIQRRKIAAISHCHHCGKVEIVYGHDQRDLPEDLPGLK